MARALGGEEQCGGWGLARVRGGGEEVAGEVIYVRSGFLMEPQGIYAAINGAAGD